MYSKNGAGCVCGYPDSTQRQRYPQDRDRGLEGLKMRNRIYYRKYQCQEAGEIDMRSAADRLAIEREIHQQRYNNPREMLPPDDPDCPHGEFIGRHFATAKHYRDVVLRERDTARRKEQLRENNAKRWEEVRKIKQSKFSKSKSKKSR